MSLPWLSKPWLRMAAAVQVVTSSVLYGKLRLVRRRPSRPFPYSQRSLPVSQTGRNSFTATHYKFRHMTERQRQIFLDNE